jgi:hypothetical protein
MGSEESFDANLAFSRNNTSTKRVIYGQIVGNMSASAAGAEAGQLWFRTKDAADAATVTRMTINGSGLTLAVPITGKAFVNTPITQTLFSNTTDLTADYPLMVSKSGGGATTTGVALGSNNVDRSTLVFNQLNSAGTRLIGSRIVGMNSSNAAGAEKGYLVFDTKSASDASAVARLTLSEVAAAFAEPITTTGEVSTTTGTETLPAHSFTADNDTGMYRSAANNLDFSTGGTRRFQIDSSGRLYGYSAGGDLLTLKTTANNGLLQIDTASGTANINNLTWHLTSAGSALLILRNDAKTAYISPIAIQRNASSGTSNVSFRVGGDANVNGSDMEAGRFVVSPDGTQGKLLVGHTAQDIYLNNADASPTQNFQIHSYKTTGNGPVSLLGTDGTNTSFWASARTNTASKRVVQTSVGGVSVSSTAGVEKGRLELSTKAAADAGVVVRASIDETGATFTVPVSTTGNVSGVNLFASSKLYVNSADGLTMFNGATDETADHVVHVSKPGGGSLTTGVSIGGNNGDRSVIGFNQLNTSGTRVMGSRIVGLFASNTAGAEKGSLSFQTKGTADAALVTRLQISEAGATMSIPTTFTSTVSVTGNLTAPNLSYATKVVSASLVNDGITSIAAGITINTSDCAAGRVFQIYNNSASAITITQGAGLTMRLVGTATTGNRTIAQRGLATFTCISGTEVVVQGAT